MFQELLFMTLKHKRGASTLIINLQWRKHEYWRMENTGAHTVDSEMIFMLLNCLHLFHVAQVSAGLTLKRCHLGFKPMNNALKKSLLPSLKAHIHMLSFGLVKVCSLCQTDKFGISSVCVVLCTPIWNTTIPEIEIVALPSCFLTVTATWAVKSKDVACTMGFVLRNNDTALIYV